MKKIIFFSNNEHKVLEIKKLFNKTNINIVGLEKFPKINIPKENGLTFKENAKIKSDYFFKKFDKPCFADDSGICISALDNLPGVRSKRFIKINGGYKKTFKKIIEKTNIASNYKAYFHTCIALTLSLEKTIFFEGRVYGKISKIPIGKHGFHYDPIFIPNGFNKTFAEMSAIDKNKISHRSIAVNKLKKYLLRFYK